MSGAVTVPAPRPGWRVGVALAKAKAEPAAPGATEMTVDELKAWAAKNGLELVKADEYESTVAAAEASAQSDGAWVR